MVDIFYIIIIVVVIGLWGGLIYLIYLPFKNRLIKSGKLTDKLNRQINRTFIFLLCLVGVLLYCFKDYRTPSKDRLESASNIELPDDFKVIKDEYQDMWQDYCVLYDIQFDNKATKQLIKTIKTSEFYNPNVNPKSMLYDSLYIRIDNIKAVWCKSSNGYRFSRQEGLTDYSVDLDTLTNVLNYIECAD
jgi:cbb3-type cytochrome oxidase subunit 3